MFGMLSRSARYKRVYSNKLRLHVKPLEGTKYVGDFEISLSLDKDKINANESVNALLKISGYGNFDDIGEFALDTKASYFSDKPHIKTNVAGSKMQGVFEQKFSLSSAEDFQIKPIAFIFYSKKEDKIKTIYTKTLNVKVANSTEREKELFIPANTEEKTLR